MMQGSQWPPSVAWPPAAAGCGASLGFHRAFPGVLLGRLGRQACLLESFCGGQLWDLSKSEKWKQLGVEAALPSSLSPLCLSSCLSTVLSREVLGYH